jgi:hypothetical protein
MSLWRRLDLNQWGGGASIDLQSIAFNHSATSPFVKDTAKEGQIPCERIYELKKSCPVW